MNWLKKILKHTLAEQENRLLIVSSPLVFMHLACIGIFFTGFSWVAVWALLITYFVRVFALTAVSTAIFLIALLRQVVFFSLS